jgi:hypothetical protein
VIQEADGNSVQWLVGKAPSTIRPLPPYHPDICNFVSELSSSLSGNKDARQYPDVISFAFWCRRANIRRIKAEFCDRYERLGLGLAFHVTPSNVPVNFAFSFLFGLLSGNANIVRVPSRAFPQIGIICSEIDRILGSPEYLVLREMNAFVRYSRNDALTEELCALCDVRVIWGGDLSINYLHGFPVHERCVDISFSDRYSFCIMATDAVKKCDQKQLNNLAQKFYNDTLLMDQDACSSPRLVVWIGKKDPQTREKFWNAIYEVAQQKYSLDFGSVAEKYTKFCQDVMSFENLNDCKMYGNKIYCLSVTELPNDLEKYRGKCGYFYEFETDDISNLTGLVTKKIQTLTYFGMEKHALKDFVVNNRLLGIDRIVPVGQGLEMDVIWDGIDVIRSMTRIIDIS